MYIFEESNFYYLINYVFLLPNRNHENEMQVSANLKPGQSGHFSQLQNLVWWPPETLVFMDRKLISKCVLDCVFPACFDAVRCSFNHF